MFFIAYEAFFIPFGFTFWGVLLSAPAWLPIVLGLALSALVPPAGIEEPGQEDEPGREPTRIERRSPQQDLQLAHVPTGSGHGYSGLHGVRGAGGSTGGKVWADAQ
ncbi:PPE family protein [Mycobacteroides abscessus subsp. abscessus]|nr:PPE family protein [Mycobacteroides abscessus subsp. abscessus]